MKKSVLYVWMTILLFLPAVAGTIWYHRRQMHRLELLEAARQELQNQSELSWRVFRLSENYRSECRLMLREFQDCQEQKIRCSLDQARRELPAVLKQLCGTGASLGMMSRMLADQIRNTEEFHNYCSRMTAPVNAPCRQAEIQTGDSLRNFQHLLEERRRQYLTDLAYFQQGMQAGDDENFSSGDLSSSGDIRKLVSAKMGAVTAVALEGMFIRDSLRILNAFFVRGTAAAGCAAADGPMPFGDIAGAALTGWGLGDAAWNVYQAQSRMPEMLARNMEAGLRTLEKSLLQRMKNRSAELAECCLKQSEALEQLLQRKLKENHP